VIPQRDIVAWRAHAPWSDDVMVEQDWLLGRAVQLVFASPKLARQLAMRGGTVLHKAHLPPAARYSEDIDLVLVVSNRSHKGTATTSPMHSRPCWGGRANRWRRRLA
jgi:Nucleotidyl transferase AbiEii toxin, Type IV TA system